MIVIPRYQNTNSQCTENEKYTIVSEYLRQEENQFLAVPRDVAKKYDRPTQEFIRYSMSDPACGFHEEMDPIYALYPELLESARPKDF